MAEFSFPTNYKSVYDNKQTRYYISTYISLLSQLISKNHNAIYVDVPVLTSVTNTWNSTSRGERFISFDNKHNTVVSQLFNNIDNYIRWIFTDINPNNDAGIYTYAPVINRDLKHSNTKANVSYNFYVELNPIVDNQDKVVQSLITNFTNDLQTINYDKKFNDFKRVKELDHRINFITIEELAKLYPLLTLERAMQQYVVTNGATAIKGVYKTLKNGKKLELGLPSSADYDKTTKLYIFNPITNTIMPIMEVTIRPTREIILKQLNSEMPEVINSRLLNGTLLNEKIEFLPSYGIKIYFTNLMMINLKKCHISEVVHSVWPDEFVNYITHNKIKIM